MRNLKIFNDSEDVGEFEYFSQFQIKLDDHIQISKEESTKVRENSGNHKILI